MLVLFKLERSFESFFLSLMNALLPLTNTELGTVDFERSNTVLLRFDVAIFGNILCVSTVCGGGPGIYVIAACYHF